MHNTTTGVFCCQRSDIAVPSTLIQTYSRSSFRWRSSYSECQN